MTASIRVLLVCSGLDHARRGFESFARECFEALRGEPALEIELVKASGPARPGEWVVPALRRDRAPAIVLAKALRRPSFRVEALTFALALQPLLARRRPDVVYLSEWDTARALAALRRARGHTFKLLLCNGGFASRGFDHLDHVQELTPAGRDYVLARGADPRRHTVLPLGFQIERELMPLSPEERAALRRRLALPEARPIILTVAAFNRAHKRLDYLIEEVAALPQPRPFLLMAGEPDADTVGLWTLARRLLGDGGFEMLTLDREEMTEHYRASDVFVLGSVVEAQGRALIEAMAHGLPCIAHDSPVMRYAVGDHGELADLARRGSLARLLSEPPAIDPAAAHRHVYERFSWERLRPRYVELLREVALANSTVSSSTGENVSR